MQCESCSIYYQIAFLAQGAIITKEQPMNKDGVIETHGPMKKGGEPSGPPKKDGAAEDNREIPLGAPVHQVGNQTFSRRKKHIPACTEGAD